MSAQSLPLDTAALLDAVGGEPLAGSGFEVETPEPSFAQVGPAEDEVQRRR